jgi:hypothetical protein
MREIRHEELKDEALLPFSGKPASGIDKNCRPMETLTLTPKDKHDTARPSVKSNYREDENIS